MVAPLKRFSSKRELDRNQVVGGGWVNKRNRTFTWNQNYYKIPGVPRHALVALIFFPTRHHLRCKNRIQTNKNQFEYLYHRELLISAPLLRLFTGSSCMTFQAGVDEVDTILEFSWLAFLNQLSQIPRTPSAKPSLVTVNISCASLGQVQGQACGNTFLKV